MTPEIRRAHAAFTAAAYAFRRSVVDEYERAKAASDADPRSLSLDERATEAGRLACAVDRIVIPTLSGLGVAPAPRDDGMRT